MRTMITRLKSAVTDRELAWGQKIAKKDLAQAAKVSSAAVTNWWKNENTRLDAKCIFGLARFLEISPEWLQSGVGEMESTVDPENIGVDKPSIRQAKRALSDVATDLILCVVRLDGAGVTARQILAQHLGLVSIAEQFLREQDVRTDLNAAEVIELLETRSELTGPVKHGTNE